MQLTNTLKSKVALGLLAFSTSFASLGASQAIDGSFQTIKDVTIIEVTPMVVNGLLMSSATGECTMTVDATAALYVGDTVMNLAATGQNNGPGVNAGDIPADPNACVASTGTVGIYEIDGSPGALVKITFTDATTGSVGFAPAGCAGDYDGAGDGDSCKTIVSGTSTHKLASTGDLTNSAGEGTPVAGKTRVALGGTADALVGLSAATTYNVTFGIDVTY